MGVRIEDDYAVTSTGVEWLSGGAPREVAEIEATMRAGARRRGVGRANACGGPAPDVRP
jgi:hypothetical protein